MRSTPESGSRTGYDGHKRKNGSKAHPAVDTLGHLLVLAVTPADGNDRRQVRRPAAAVQGATGGHVDLAYVDQGYGGEAAGSDAALEGIDPAAVRLPEAKKGFVLLPRRWVAERSSAWATRFRRLTKDYGRLPGTLAGLHVVAFVTLMLSQFTAVAGGSS